MPPGDESDARRRVSGGCHRARLVRVPRKRNNVVYTGNPATAVGAWSRSGHIEGKAMMKQAPWREFATISVLAVLVAVGAASGDHGAGVLLRDYTPRND